MDADEALKLIQKEFTECPLCADTFVKPKILPCMHTFCLSCLERLGRGRLIGAKLACPICRQEFTIPCDRFESFPNNFNVNRLLELHQLCNKPPEETLWCKDCKVNSDDIGASCMTKVSSYCEDCQKKLCKACAFDHKCKEHAVKTISSDTNAAAADCFSVGEEERENSYKTTCSQHTNEKRNIYCIDCSVITCVKCFCQQHNTHNCCDIDEARTRCSAEFDAELKSLQATMSLWKKFSNRQLQSATSVCANVAQIEMDIKKEANKMKQVIEKQKHQLLQDLNAKKADSLLQLQKSKALTDSYVSDIDDVTKHAVQLKNSKNSLAVLLCLEKLKEANTKYQKIDVGRVIRQQYYFFPSFSQESPSNQTCLIGNIIDLSDDQPDESDDNASDEDFHSIMSPSTGGSVAVEGRDSLQHSHKFESSASNCSIPAAKASDDDSAFAQFVRLSDLTPESMFSVEYDIDSSSTSETTCTRCGLMHEVIHCTYPPHISCFKCGGNHHIRVCPD